MQRRTKLIDRPNNAYQNARETLREDAEITHVGPGTPGGEYLRRFWHPIAFTKSLEDVPLRVRVMGEDLVLFRDKSNRIGLLVLHCSHRGTSLEFGLYPGTWHRLLLSWLAFRRRRHHPRYASGTAGQHAKGSFAPRRLSDPRVQRARVRLSGSARERAAISRIRDLHTARIPERAMGRQCAAVQLGPDQRKLHGSGAHGVPAYDRRGHRFHRLLRRSARTRLPARPQRYGLYSCAARRREYLGAHDQPDYAQYPSIRADLERWPSGRDFCPPQCKPTGRYRSTIRQRSILGFNHIHADDPDPALLEAGANFGQARDRPYAERQRVPGDYDAHVSIGPVAVHSREYLGHSDLGVAMFRKMLRRNIRAIKQGKDPQDISADIVGKIPAYANDTVVRVPPRNDPEADRNLCREIGQKVARAAVSRDWSELQA